MHGETGVGNVAQQIKGKAQEAVGQVQAEIRKAD